MPLTKNAILRHRVLDRCFGNSGKEYTIEDLLGEVNHVLVESGSEGISIRTLRKDIRFFRMMEGYDAPLDTRKTRGKYIYTYSERDFSINNREMDATEAEQLQATLLLLSRFRGHPQLQWLEEILPKLRDKFGLDTKERADEVMAFQSNLDYTGHEFLTPLFNAIVNKRVLNVRYKPFTESEQELIFHPYHLKQHNNRWFVFGLNPATGISSWTLALDRIVSLNQTSEPYLSCDIDWLDHFYDIYGVTKPAEAEPVNVELWFSPQQAPYISTKPIHGTQKSSFHDDGSMTARFTLIPNHEFESLILGFGEGAKVLKPESLREKIAERVRRMADAYAESNTD